MKKAESLIALVNRILGYELIPEVEYNPPVPESMASMARKLNRSAGYELVPEGPGPRGRGPKRAP